MKFFASERIETNRLTSVLEEWVHARVANQRALTLLHVGQSTIIAVGIAAVMLRAAQQVVAGTMSVGDLVLVNAYIVQVCNPLNTLGFVFRETNDAFVNVERMFNILLSRGRVREDVDEAGAQPLVVTGDNQQAEVLLRSAEMPAEAIPETVRHSLISVQVRMTRAILRAKRSGRTSPSSFSTVRSETGAEKCTTVSRPLSNSASTRRKRPTITKFSENSTLNQPDSRVGARPT